VSYDRIHQLCERRSKSRIDSNEVPKTRLAPKGIGGRKRAYADGDAMDTSATVTGKRGRAPDDAAEPGARDWVIRGSDAAWVIFTRPLSCRRKY